MEYAERVELYIEKWYLEKQEKHKLLSHEIERLENTKDETQSLYFDTLKKYNGNIHNKKFKRFRIEYDSVINSINIKLDEKKENLVRSRLFLDEDFIYNYCSLNYLESEIKEDNVLKYIISLILEEINTYAKMNYYRLLRNKELKNKRVNRFYEKKIKYIDSLLLDLPELREGLGSVFETLIYSKEDLELRDVLHNYKKKIEKNINHTKTNDSEYEVFRDKLRLILNTIHSSYGILKKKKEIDNLVKSLRPELFKSSKK